MRHVTGRRTISGQNDKRTGEYPKFAHIILIQSKSIKNVPFIIFLHCWHPRRKQENLKNIVPAPASIYFAPHRVVRPNSISRVKRRCNILNSFPGFGF